MHRYFPHTEAEVKAMLSACGVEELRGLYSDVPEELLLAHPYNLPAGMSDSEVRSEFDRLASENLPVRACFAGGGFYDHQVPAAAMSLIGRSEFLTAYTPYQPEISQGTLQYIFEYQTMMSRLTGLPVSNASMYDGATATAEAMLMAVAAKRKADHVLVSATLLPAVRRVVDTYARYHGVKVTTIPEADGVTSLEELERLLAGHKDVAGVILPQPNRYGILEDFTGVADKVHASKALLILNCIAADLATLRTPGEWGADIACGDAQSLGIPLSYGGPYLGYLCATKTLMRKMPGRIVGATTDARGQRCFVLTLQAREQHIRREKATSNICSNQGLMTLYVTIFMGLMGTDGLRELVWRGHNMACYLLQELTATGRCRLAFPDKPFLNEFVLDVDSDISLNLLMERCIREAQLLPGIKIGEHRLQLACTEMQTREDADRLVEIFKSL